MRRISALMQVVIAATSLLTAGFASAQTTSTVPLKVSPSDLAAPTIPGSLAYRAEGLAGSRAAAPSTIPVLDSSINAADDISSLSGPGFFPADVSNPSSMPSVVTTSHHPMYVDNVPAHWGNVGGFLTDLGKSDFIHLLDQYVGSSADNRYTLGTSFLAGYPISANHTLAIGDILALVHAGAAIKGNGFGHIYHVFLPAGVDMCLSPTACYSPDNPNTFYFCAFHGSVTFGDAVGHVLFSVEPYQNVSGCSVPPTGTANNQLVDSTDTVLSHEVFEALSDPDGNAWWVQAFTFAYGEEIGDLCTRSGAFNGSYYWKYGNVRLNGHPYTIQPEYSNEVHGCVYH